LHQSKPHPGPSSTDACPTQKKINITCNGTYCISYKFLEKTTRHAEPLNEATPSKVDTRNGIV